MRIMIHMSATSGRNRRYVIVKGSILIISHQLQPCKCVERKTKSVQKKRENSLIYLQLPYYTFRNDRAKKVKLKILNSFYCITICI
jgi:hypothetical protein